MRVGLRLAAIGAATLAFVLFLVGINLTQGKVTFTSYECDDYDYAADECDGSYQAEGGETLRFKLSEVGAAGEGEFEYDNSFLKDFDGIGRLKSMAPLYITGTVLTGICALGLGVGLFMRFPLHLVMVGLLGASLVLMVLGLVLGLSGAAAFVDFIDEDADEPGSGDFYEETSSLKWGPGPILVLIGLVALVAAGTMGGRPARSRLQWSLVPAAEAAGNAPRARPPPGPVDFDAAPPKAAPAQRPAAPKSPPAQAPASARAPPAGKAPAPSKGPGAGKAPAKKAK
jgi:hypothetical protein